MSWTNESWPLCLSHFTGVSMLSDLQAVPKKGGLLFWSIFKYYLILVLSIQVGIFRWNAQPFKAGIANQIFIWVHLYLSCWMGAWWYGSDHNDLLSCLESFQGWFDLVKSRKYIENLIGNFSLKWLTIDHWIKFSSGFIFIHHVG